MGKERLFEQFITQHLNNAYRFAYIHVNNEQMAEDVVSESVIKALKSLHRLKNDSFMKTWFYKIILNTSRTYLRRNNKIVYMDDEALERHMELYENDSRIYFEEMIKSLPDDDKTIIVLRFFENMKFREISQILSLNENTVKTKLYKSLKILKAEVEGE